MSNPGPEIRSDDKPQRRQGDRAGRGCPTTLAAVFGDRHQQADLLRPGRSHPVRPQSHRGRAPEPLCPVRRLGHRRCLQVRAMESAVGSRMKEDPGIGPAVPERGRPVRHQDRIGKSEAISGSRRARIPHPDRSRARSRGTSPCLCCSAQRERPTSRCRWS